MRILSHSFFLSLFSLSLSAQPAFTDVTDTAGIDHQFRVFEGMFGGGVCAFDFNNDGYDDLYITGGMNEDVLYLNQGDGTFKNIFEGSGLELTRKFVTQGVASADVNRDGWVDLFVTTITSKDSLQIIPRARNLLFLNNGNETFRDATAEYGLEPLYSFSTGGSFGDFNADGWPDLYVGNYFIEYEGELSVISDATIVGANQTARGYLLRNDEGKGFTNVYEDWGLDYRGFGFGGVFTDFDNDGDQDLFVNHDFGYKATPDFLLENRSFWNKFRDVGEELGMDLKINSMSSAPGDWNGDGILEYYVTNIRFNRFMVRPALDSPFVDRSKELGMNYVSISWGVNWVDFDHDGDLDLFVANGDLNPNCVPMADFYFDNQGSTFVEMASQKGVNDYGIGRGSVVFDLENDGDLDILVVNQIPVLNYPTESRTRLFRNDGADGNWLQVRLRGVNAEMNGIGSRVTVVSEGRRMIREIDGGGSSHLSQNATLAHFGLGAAERVDSIIVTWTGGKEQILLDEPANQLLVIEEVPLGRGSWLIWLGAIIALGILTGVFLWLQLGKNILRKQVRPNQSENT